MRSRVLLVEDDDLLRRSWARVLQTEGHLVEQERSADAALAREDLAQFTMIVTDYHMPGTDGLAFLRTVQRRAPAAFRVLATARPDLVASLQALIEEGVVQALHEKPADIRLITK